MVALLAEGVDRNHRSIAKVARCSTSPSSQRAWIEIDTICGGEPYYALSPSSQRAWIEILEDWTLAGASLVALLAEGVDRNPHSVSRMFRSWGSPSSQRAWIEIQLIMGIGGKLGVALLAEGVDRNYSATL